MKSAIHAFKDERFVRHQSKHTDKLGLISASSNWNQQSGIALIEILISVVVLSVGLLGLVGLQMLSVKGSQHAHFKNQATLLSQGMFEKMRANPNGDYLQAVDCSSVLGTDCATNNCDADQLAHFDLHQLQCGTKVGDEWIGGVKTLLPNGALQVMCADMGDWNSCLAEPGVTVDLQWDERTVNANDDVEVNGMMHKVLQMSARID